MTDLLNATRAGAVRERERPLQQDPPRGQLMPPLITMGWLRLVGSLTLYVSFAKEPYKRDYVLQKRHLILRSLLIVATPYLLPWTNVLKTGARRRGVSTPPRATHLRISGIVQKD